MALSKTGGKARYTVALTISNVERFRSLARDLGMPSSSMNLALDDSLVELAALFQQVKDQGGKFGVGDLVKLMASKVAESLEIMEVKNDAKTVAKPTKQKRNIDNRRKTL